MVNISCVLNEAPLEIRGELEDKVYKVLKELDIKFERVDNDSVESMEDCLEISEKLGAEIRKSVFLSNHKKTNFYLVILPAAKSFNTKKFCEKIGCSRVSFASAKYMEEILGVSPGTVTIMSLLNDKTKRVQLVIDKEVAASEWFACNPGANTSHIKIKTKDLIDSFIPHTGHRAVVREL
jgi:Ala-tRNA(Pro) deacylase